MIVLKILGWVVAVLTLTGAGILAYEWWWWKRFKSGKSIWPWVTTRKGRRQTKRLRKEDAWFSPEPIRGWRMGGMSLLPLLNSEGRAECRAEWYSSGEVHHPPGAPVPALDCTCGFYALKHRDDAALWDQNVVEVEMWGLVIEHERGYRAERMRRV